MKNEKKSMLVTVFAILALLVIVGGATYAYFQAQTGTGATTPITITTNTTDSLTFIEGSAINLYVEVADFGLGAGNKSGTTTTKANLIANNTTNTATANYNVFFIVDGNTFEYTTEEQTAELIMTVTDPNGNPVTNIEGLNYVTSGGVSGFDITARANNQNLTGSFLIASNYEISASLADGQTGSAQTEQSWTVTVTLVNLDTDQNKNTDKSLSARVVITTDEEPTYEIAQINNAQTVTTATSATVTLDDVTPGIYALEKYYFGVEEVSGTTAMNNSNVLRLGMLAAAEDATWYESSTNSYTFTNLKDDTSYIFYAYGVDTNGIKTATYATSEIKTLVYTLAQVSASATSTYNSITITASGTDGEGTIAKYYYTVDYKTDGSTVWEPIDGTAETTYTINDLIINTAYNVAVKAVDSNGRETNPYVLTVTTEYILPTVTVTATATHNSITVTANGTNGTGTITTYYYSINNGAYISSASNSYTFSDLSPNTSYTISVYLVDDAGFLSETNSQTFSTEQLSASEGVQALSPEGLNTTMEGGLYRFQGTAGNVNNYICFGTSNKSTCTGNTDAYMYRIMGINSQGQLKLIKNEALNSAMQWYDDYATNITWTQSTIYSSINGSAFLMNTTYVPSEWRDKIATTTWKYGDVQGPNLSQDHYLDYTAIDLYNKENAWTTTTSSKIGLMYEHDYYAYQSEGLNCAYVSNGVENSVNYTKCKKSWSHLSNCDSGAPSENEWTMSRYGYYSAGDCYYTWVMLGVGLVTNANMYNMYSVRPVFFLTADVQFVSGTGELSDPFIIS